MFALDYMMLASSISSRPSFLTIASWQNTMVKM